MSGYIPVVFRKDQLGEPDHETDHGHDSAPLQYKYHLPRPHDVAVLVPEESHSATVVFLEAIASNASQLGALQEGMRATALSLQYSHPKFECDGGRDSAVDPTCRDAVDTLMVGLAARGRRIEGGT